MREIEEMIEKLEDVPGEGHKNGGEIKAMVRGGRTTVINSYL